MKELAIINTVNAERTLISYKGFNFEVGNYSVGINGRDRKVFIQLIDSNLKTSMFKRVGIIKLFSTDEFEKQVEEEQMIIRTKTTFKECLIEAKKYIREYVDFVKDDK